MVNHCEDWWSRRGRRGSNGLAACGGGRAEGVDEEGEQEVRGAARGRVAKLPAGEGCEEMLPHNFHQKHKK